MLFSLRQNWQGSEPNLHPVLHLTLWLSWQTGPHVGHSFWTCLPQWDLQLLRVSSCQTCSVDTGVHQCPSADLKDSGGGVWRRCLGLSPAPGSPELICPHPLIPPGPSPHMAGFHSRNHRGSAGSSACFTSPLVSFRKQEGKVSTSLPHHQVSMSRPPVPLSLS